ncbi:adenylyl cyclase, partial [Haematococcus lacustris]
MSQTALEAKLQPGDWADMAPRGLQYQGRGAAWRQRLLGFVNSPWYYVLLVLAALFVVFADDVKRAALPPTADLPLEAVLCGVWSIIILDMAISSCIKPGYFFGFYWWLDLIAISSLAFEVPALAQRTMGVGGQPASAQDRERLYTWVSQQALILAQVARVARAFRLLRLLRLLTLYKRFSAKRRARAALAKAGITPGAEHGILAAQDLTLIELEILQNGNKESRVGQKLDELIIRRIIVFILICALLLPPLNPYLGVLGRGQALDVGGLKMLHDMAVAKPSLPTQIGIGGPSNGSLLNIATQ